MYQLPSLEMLLLGLPRYNVSKHFNTSTICLGKKEVID